MTKTIIAQLKKNKKTFEILLDFDKYIEYKDNKDNKSADIEDIIIGDFCFCDVGKAKRANDADLIQCFATLDLKKIAQEILNKGKIQITTKERQQLQENKKKQIIAFISSQCIDARTNSPLPPSRVEIALKEIKYPIDAFKNSDEQINEILKKIITVLPLKIERKEYELKIPLSDLSNIQKFVRANCKILEEKYSSDYWIVFAEINIAKASSFLEHLNRVCRNEVIVKNMNQPDKL